MVSPARKILRAIGVLQDDAVIDHPGDDSARARALIETVERTVVVVDQQHARRVRADGDDFADYALVGKHRHPGAKSVVGTRTENQRARDAVGVAADDVGGYRVGAECVLELEQLGEMLIFDFELGQLRLIALDPRQLDPQVRIFVAHVDQVEVVARDRRRAVAQMGEGAGDGADDCEECGLRPRGEIAGMNAG